jgi:hypothetical protein
MKVTAKLTDNSNKLALDYTKGAFQALENKNFEMFKFIVQSEEIKKKASEKFSIYNEIKESKNSSYLQRVDHKDVTGLKGSLSLLQAAVNTGDPDLGKWLMTVVSGESLLSCAIQAKNLDLFKMIIETKFESVVNGMLMQQIVQYGGVPMIKCAIEEYKAPAETTVTGFRKVPYIFLAVRGGDLETVKYFVEERKDDVNHAIYGSYSLLYAALTSANASVDVIKYLKSKEVSYFFKSIAPMGALTKQILAAAGEQINDIVSGKQIPAAELDKILAVLTNKDMPMILPGKHNLAALKGTEGFNIPDADEFIFEKLCDEIFKALSGKQLFAAISSGNLAVVKYVLEECAVNPDEINSSLIYASMKSNNPSAEIVKYLVEEMKVNYSNIPLQLQDARSMLYDNEGKFNVVAEYLKTLEAYKPYEPKELTSEEDAALKLALEQGALEWVDDGEDEDEDELHGVASEVNSEKTLEAYKPYEPKELTPEEDAALTLALEQGALVWEDDGEDEDELHGVASEVNSEKTLEAYKPYEPKELTPELDAWATSILEQGALEWVGDGEDEDELHGVASEVNSELD